MPHDLPGIPIVKVPGKAGIYSITHLESGATYVGKSTNCPKRISDHCTQLRKGCHHNGPLQMLFIRDGMEAFKFEILWSAPARCTEASLLEAEHYAMQSVHDMGRELLNVLRPPTRDGLAFSIGPGGRWKRRTPATGSIFDDLPCAL